jgi:hypothetical protein
VLALATRGQVALEGEIIVRELPGMLGQTGNAIAARRRRKAQNRQNARRTLAERQKGLLPVSCQNVV